MANNKCRAKDPSACVDPNCPEKRGLNSLHGLNAAIDALTKTSPFGNPKTAAKQTFNPLGIIAATYDPEELELLATDPTYTTRMAVAENIHTPVKTLQALTFDESAWVRENVADNFNTPVTSLRILATDYDDSVRSNVARNPNTPVSTLQILARDESEWVRKEVAANFNTPSDALYLLLTDKSSIDVRKAAWENPNTTDTMRSFAIVVGDKTQYTDDWDI